MPISRLKYSCRTVTTAGRQPTTIGTIGRGLYLNLFAVFQADGFLCICRPLHDISVAVPGHQPASIRGKGCSGRRLYDAGYFFSGSYVPYSCNRVGAHGDQVAPVRTERFRLTRIPTRPKRQLLSLEFRELYCLVGVASNQPQSNVSVPTSHRQPASI